MKKFLAVCIICLLSILAVYYFWCNPQIMQNVFVPISDAVDSYIQEETPYTEEFIINDINIKSDNYYYNKLDKNHQAIYKSLANGVKELKSEFYIKDYKFVTTEKAMEDVEIAMESFLLDHPEVFYLADKYTVATSQNFLGDKLSLRVNYTVSSIEELNTKIELIKSEMQKIINEANITTGNIFQNELNLHDVLGKRVGYCEYDNIQNIPHSAHTIYGAFVEKSAVCDGFSKALQILLDKAGIESIVITGSLEGEAHAWNMVKLDGSWYHVDITSNKSINDYPYVVVHAYFNVNNREIQRTHLIDNIGQLPSATNEKYNYFVYLDKVIKNTDDFNAKLEKILLNNQDKEKIEYKVLNVDEVPEKTIEILRNGKYYQYLDVTLTRFVYYNILDNYVIIKR